MRTLYDAGIRISDMSDISKILIDGEQLSVSARPQMRADDVIATALALYNKDNLRTTTQTITLALRQFLPTKYLERAQLALKSRNGAGGKRRRR